MERSPHPLKNSFEFELYYFIYLSVGGGSGKTDFFKFIYPITSF